MKPMLIKSVNTLITYYSQTGNTEKIARAIYQVIPGEKSYKKLSEVHSVEKYDIIFLGFPICNFEPAKPAKEFLLKNAPDKNIALFITMSLTAAPANDQITELYKLTLNNCKSYVSPENILGIFDCPGELSKVTANALLDCSDPALQNFGRMRDITLGFPNEMNMKSAEAFALDIIEKFCYSKDL